jgi:hypothetical protein
MGWSALDGGRDGFDHALAGWPLRGAHRASPCERCHTVANDHGVPTYLGAEARCASCHAQDLHRFVNREISCERCHFEDGWMPAKPRLDFDHDNRADARMFLGAAHAAVACATCHPANRFGLGSTEPDRCDTCHASPHAGHLFQRECTQCHSPTVSAFDDLRVFDHAERTAFDLGGHDKMACATCHPASLGTKKPSGACEPCHARDSRHGTRFKAFGAPPRCAACHSVHSESTPKAIWRPNRFDHGKTKFPLDGAHAMLSCRDCHRGTDPSTFERFTSKQRCIGCHAHTNVHDNRYADGQCLMCHVRPGRTP